MKNSVSWMGKHKVLSGVAVVILIIIIASAAGGSKNKVTPNSAAQPASKQTTSKVATVPQDTHPHFSDGTYKVGSDIQPGTYRTRTASAGCYWERMKDFTGGVDSILANDNTDFPAVVAIQSTDAGFQSRDCGTWTQDLSAITTSQTSFQDGVYIVGTDIQPGTYKSSGETGCYWARLSDFTFGTDSILANDNTDNPTIVTIQSTDKGFQSKDCGAWTKQ